MGVIFTSFISFLHCTRNGPSSRSSAGRGGRCPGAPRSSKTGLAGCAPHSTTWAGSAPPMTRTRPPSRGRRSPSVCPRASSSTTSARRGAAFMMRDASTTTARKEQVDLPNLEVKTLRDFVNQQPQPQRMWAWRCVAGAEPSPDRLHHIHPDVQHDCETCGVPATTRHLLWECRSTTEQRVRTRIHPHTLPRLVPENERAALLLNGWFRAIWDPPAGVSQADWAEHHHHIRHLSSRILRYKMQTLQPYYDILAGRCAF